MKWVQRLRRTTLFDNIYKSRMARSFFNYLIRTYSKAFCLLAKGLSTIGRKHPYPSENNANINLILITVAFNNDLLINKQIELVKQFISDDDYQHIIIDNSTRKKMRKRIASLCKKNDIEYIAIPHMVSWLAAKNIYANGYSHGCALNWTYRFVIKPRNPEVFMLLDHDLFPLKDISVKERLGTNDFLGVRREPSREWYLWPGWSIFRLNSIANYKPDFMPLYVKKQYLDSGGSMYKRVFRHYNINTIEFPTTRTLRIKQTKGLKLGNDIYHGDCIQFIDETWLHLINGSNCAHIKGKETFVKHIIDNIPKVQAMLK